MKRETQRQLWLPLAAVIFLGAAALSGQSYWIDEASTATLACQRTAGDWWRTLLNDGGSSTQMPLYMFFLWLWEKAFGHGEWALRAANLPWLALALFAFARRQRFLLMATLLSPFVWSYLNEARPYLMQVAVSLLIAAALWRLAELQAEEDLSGTTPAPECPQSPSLPLSAPPPTRAPGNWDVVIDAVDGSRRELDSRARSGGERLWTACFCLALVVMAGSSLLGVIWDAAALGCALAILGWAGLIRLAWRHSTIVALSAASLLLLAAFYFWSLRHGARATPGATGPINVVFAAYELLGLSGLGPGRIQIRYEGKAAFLPFIIPLGAHAAAAALVLWAGGKWAAQETPRRLWLGVAAALGGATALLFVAAHVSHFRALGRHFAPLAGFFVLLTAAGLFSLWRHGGWRRALVLFFLLASLASAASMRLAQRHAKDDYRGAIALANSAVQGGERVWWCADKGAARLYCPGFSLDQATAPAAGAWLAVNRPLDVLTAQPPPHLIVLSKPDLYDPAGALRDYITSRHYQLWRSLPAFTLWRAGAQ